MARLKAHATKHLKFSIPFNGDLAFLEESLERWPVYEVHFSGPARAGSSDAVTGNGPGCSLKTFRAVVALCRRHRVQTNLLCNAFSAWKTIYCTQIGGDFGHVCCISPVFIGRG